MPYYSGTTDSALSGDSPSAPSSPGESSSSGASSGASGSGAPPKYIDESPEALSGANSPLRDSTPASEKTKYYQDTASGDSSSSSNSSSDVAATPPNPKYMNTIQKDEAGIDR